MLERENEGNPKSWQKGETSVMQQGVGVLLVEALLGRLRASRVEQYLPREVTGEPLQTRGHQKAVCGFPDGFPLKPTPEEYLYNNKQAI